MKRSEPTKFGLILGQITVYSSLAFWVAALANQKIGTYIFTRLDADKHTSDGSPGPAKAPCLSKAEKLVKKIIVYPRAVSFDGLKAFPFFIQSFETSKD